MVGQKKYRCKRFFETDAKIFFGACLPLAYLTSCQAPHFYKPKPHEPVLLNHSHQAKINLVSDDNLNAFSIAYSPKEHLGLTAGIGSYEENSYTGERYFNPYLSAGYYKKLPLNILIETYGGIGVYNYKNKDDATVKKIRFYNYFVQPSFAYIHRSFEIALTLRIDYLKRYKTEISNNSTSGDYNFDFLKYDNYFFLQPGCTIRFGFNNIKFQIQATKSNPFSNKYGSIYGTVYDSELDENVFDHSMKCGIGITLGFDIFRKKIK